jgi:C_GCAxxG_C_C family probable redox protein
MNLKKDRAIAGFRSGLNCAQAVLSSYTETYDVDNNTALSLSCGFGAGMGRLQETCGAVTGAFMVFGLHNCRKYNSSKEQKENSYLMIREFEMQFRKIHGTMKCKDLLKIDLQTPEGQQSFHDDQLNILVCEKCIADSISIIDNVVQIR